MSDYNSNDSEKLSKNVRKTTRILIILFLISVGTGSYCIYKLVTINDVFDYKTPGYATGIAFSFFFALLFFILLFASKVARYQTAQMAPIAKDTTNYMLEGTKNNIVDIGSKIMSGHNKQDQIICPSCKHSNDIDATFCDNCGKPLSIKCNKCGTMNDVDAKFCRECGKRFR